MNGESLIDMSLPRHEPTTDASGGSARQARLAEAIDEFYAAVDAGTAVDRERLLEKYADVAAELAGCLSNLDFIQNVAPQLAGEDAVPRSDPRPGMASSANLGDFRIVREIGRGGMGVVYEAEQLSLGRRVALKVLPFAAMLDKQQLARFKNEARAAATLDHPNIVAVHSVGVERGVHYYSMQLVEGRSLADVITRLRNDQGMRNAALGLRTEVPDATVDRRAEPDEHWQTLDTAPLAALSTIPDFNSGEYYRTIALMGIQASEALDHAHQHGILHRDVKPANLLVDDDGKLWITDFGLARIEQDAGMTMTGDLLGTLRYMSPEQALARRLVVDHRSDIYSLGVTLYELLTLEPAYQGDDRQELLRQIGFEEPRPPRAINSRIPQDLQTIVLKAMGKERDDRYQTARWLADDLRAFLEDRPIQAKPPSLWVRAAKWSRRRRALVTSVGLSLLAIGAISLILLAGSNVAITRERNEKTAALQQAERNYTRALDAVDRLLARVGNQALAEVPQLDQLRKDVLEDALELFQQFLEENPNDPNVKYHTAVTYTRVAMMYHDFGNYAQATHFRDEAIALLENLYRREPADRSYRVELATALYQRAWMTHPRQQPRYLDPAVQIFQGLVDEFPDEDSYRNLLADSLLATLSGLVGEPTIRDVADVPAARKVAERALRVANSPQVDKRFLAEAISYLGRIEVCRRRFDEAEEKYLEAIDVARAGVEEDPVTGRSREHLVSHYGRLGFLLEQRGNLPQAERWYREAFATAEELRRDFPGMKNLAHSAGAGSPRDAVVRVLEAQQRIKEAIELLQSMVVVNDEDLFWRAQTYERLGQTELAKADYQTIQSRRSNR